MPNATRIEILTQLEEQLATITAANGYLTDLGDRVFYWHDLPFEYGEEGAISFRDLEEETTLNNKFYENSLLIEVEAIAFSSEPMVDGCNLLDDLLKATVRSRWLDDVISIRTTGNSKDIETKGQTCLRVVVNLSINYRVLATL
jgi:uncharacterized membrane protein